ncbi:unnamed protein product, partial [Anisakis simplex]|uniref:Papilin (inferred by orthology to a C. elegans protein) n=1 Tax=Anisakis simplex TaxID=6269 RepID=A0A0M3KKP7_ANISI
MEGPLRCTQLSARYWYDYTTRQCGAFWWRGCLGNANNFESWEECQTFCTGIGPFETTTTTPQPAQPEQYERPTAAAGTEVQPHPEPSYREYDPTRDQARQPQGQQQPDYSQQQQQYPQDPRQQPEYRQQ